MGILYDQMWRSSKFYLKMPKLVGEYQRGSESEKGPSVKNSEKLGVAISAENGKEHPVIGSHGIIILFQQLV